MLVVEDNPVNLLVVIEMLNRLGCEAERATDGQMGVDVAEETAFDLILMDISMPRMDGLEATRLIRAGKGPNAKTPILALTAHALADNRRDFYDAGMTDVLTKPLSYEHLNRVMSRTLSVENGGRAAATNTAMHELEFLLGTDGASVVMDKAVADMRAGLDKIEQVMAQNAALSNVEPLAHRLRGSAGLVGLTVLHDLFTELELSARSGASDRVQVLVGQIGEELGTMA